MIGQNIHIIESMKRYPSASYTNKNLLFFLIIAFVFVACSDDNEFGPAGNGVHQEPSFTVSVTQPPMDPTYAAQIKEMRDPDVPPLPFPDNPDPSQCGIPTVWGKSDTAYLNGEYEGEMIQPDVFLYDSHLRFNIVAQAPHGTRVEILLYQQNPVIDYYLVKITGAEQPNEGWVPAPFLSFEPIKIN